MGVVYLAQNKLMDRLEVLKVVNKALIDRPGGGGALPARNPLGGEAQP